MDDKEKLEIANRVINAGEAYVRLLEQQHEFDVERERALVEAIETVMKAISSGKVTLNLWQPIHAAISASNESNPVILPTTEPTQKESPR